MDSCNSRRCKRVSQHRCCRRRIATGLEAGGGSSSGQLYQSFFSATPPPRGMGSLSERGCARGSVLVLAAWRVSHHCSACRRSGLRDVLQHLAHQRFFTGHCLQIVDGNDSHQPLLTVQDDQATDRLLLHQVGRDCPGTRLRCNRCAPARRRCIGCAACLLKD